jgi:nitroreductase/FMN reductase [NAD(P)H]
MAAEADGPGPTHPAGWRSAAGHAPLQARAAACGRARCCRGAITPSKSDLQQRDILIVEDAAIRARINALLKDQDWIPGCPHLLVFLGNNRRQGQVHAWRGHTFANDHFDAFFNATVDVAIALEAFVGAAEAAGLGCCPISVIRNHAEEVSGLLGLPDHAFPVAGLGVGIPATPAFVSARLPLGLTVHRGCA